MRTVISPRSRGAALPDRRGGAEEVEVARGGAGEGSGENSVMVAEVCRALVESVIAVAPSFTIELTTASLWDRIIRQFVQCV